MPPPTHLPVLPTPDTLLQPVARAYPDGHEMPEHWHEAPQLIHAVSGVMELRCADGFWVISPQQALWMPAGVPHRLRVRGAVALRTVYVAPALCAARMPAQPRSLVVAPLLRELVLQARPVTRATPADGREAHLMQLLLDELALAPAIPLQLAMPRDGRLQKICLGLLHDPGDERGLEAWGRLVGASTRTLSRLFQAEFGTSFALWRQQARVFAAMPRLREGEAVARVAADLGYGSAGAFATAFRRLTGYSPRELRRQAG